VATLEQQQRSKLENTANAHHNPPKEKQAIFQQYEEFHVSTNQNLVFLHRTLLFFFISSKRSHKYLSFTVKGHGACPPRLHYSIHFSIIDLILCFDIFHNFFQKSNQVLQFD